MAGDKENRPSLLRETPLLMLMDGHAMVHRAWHGIQSPMTLSKTNEDVRGVYAFANTFIKAIQEWEPTHCAIAFDMSAPTFRHIQFPEYKAQRPETPDGLRAQFPWARRLMEAFNVPIFEVEEFEADDVLGTLSRQATEQGMETIILTGDTDTLQLVSPSVRVVLSRGIQERTIYDEVAVRERYGGLGPEQQPDVKALEGDTSDNIPGVPGVGRKTAVKLIQEFGSIQGIYSDIDSVIPPRIREAVASHEARVRQGLELTTIVTDVPITLDTESCRFWQYDREQCGWPSPGPGVQEHSVQGAGGHTPTGAAVPGSAHGGGGCRGEGRVLYSLRCGASGGRHIGDEGCRQLHLRRGDYGERPSGFGPGGRVSLGGFG